MKAPTAAVLRDATEVGRRVVAATMVEVEGSAPAPVGATMLFDEDGGVEGSLTGGCVEAALAEEAQALLTGGGPRTVAYGISDEFAGTVGLACGGTVRILVHELRGEAAKIEELARGEISAGRATAIATLLDGERAGEKMAIVEGAARGSLGRGPGLDRTVAGDAGAMLAQGIGGVRWYGEDGMTVGTDSAVLISVFARRRQGVVFGATDFSVAFARLAGEAGYEITVCDPRRPFLEAIRPQGVANLLPVWPQDAFADLDLGRGDAILVFTHDPKFDQPAIAGALRSAAGYIGALGSRRTTADRLRRLRADGFGEEALARIHAPCGLDIGSTTPEEVAISILAEMIATRSGRAGGPLREGEGPIRRR